MYRSTFQQFTRQVVASRMAAIGGSIRAAKPIANRRISPIVSNHFLAIRNMSAQFGDDRRAFSSESSSSSSESLEKEFQTAVANLQKVTIEVDNDARLKLYALYKQATNGPCTGEKPSMFNVADKAKYQAWKALGELDSEEAKRNYIGIVREMLAASGPEAATKEPELIFESKNQVYWIRLNRPKQYNAMTGESYQGVIDALKRAAEDPEIKFAVITGTGKYFSSGNDLQNFNRNLQEAGGDVDLAGERGRDLCNRFVGAFIDFPKPLIGVVNGPSFGIMFTTLGLYDLVLAADTAHFTCPFSSLGQSPEGCSTYTFPRIFGPSLASNLLYFNYRMPVAEAYERGFVSKVLPAAELDAYVTRLLYDEKTGLVGTCYPNSMMNAKNLVRNEETRMMLHQINKTECDVLMESWKSEECMEALQKFFTRKSK